MLFSRQTRGCNHRERGTIFVLWQAGKTPNWNGIDSRLMVGVFGKLLSQDFFLTVGRNNKEVHLVCIGKLVLVVFGQLKSLHEVADQFLATNQIAI